jgi:hypothetical protein
MDEGQTQPAGDLAMNTSQSCFTRAQCGRLGVLGSLLVVIGGFVDLYVYAFASMVDPRLLPAAQRLAILKSMFLTSSVIPTVFGLTVAIAGIVVCAWSSAAASGMISRTVEQGVVRWTTATLAAIVALAVLLAAMS